MIAPTALQLKATGQSELTMTWKGPDYPVGIQHYYAYVIEDSSKYCSTDRSGESCTIGGLSCYHRYNVCVVSCAVQPESILLPTSFSKDEDFCSRPSCLTTYTLPGGEQTFSSMACFLILLKLLDILVSISYFLMRFEQIIFQTSL